MKRILAIVFLTVIVLLAWWLFFKTDKESKQSEPKVEALKVKKHSENFNNKVATTIKFYLDMKNAFVEGDTLHIKSNATQFITSVDSLPLDELQKDDSLILIAAQQEVSEIKANASPILEETDLTEMRHDFSMVSENLYPFLKTIGYEGEKLYWQNCPMAFGDDKPANWLSNSSEIVNPYLGKNHPVYKSGMLNCGDNKDSLYAK
ncbi:MAG: DUF3347 domain-containing protein [Bacteroidota bacterium]|nr:DUF3347 domain-containing protein [Bacteroidota bacterium]